MHSGVVPVRECSGEPVPVVQMFSHVGPYGSQDCEVVTLSLTIRLWVMGRRQQISNTQSLADGPEVLAVNYWPLSDKRCTEGRTANTQ